MISDPHIDLKYYEGSATDCGSYICCRNGTGNAGYWGSGGGGEQWMCDIPDRTLEEVVRNAADLVAKKTASGMAHITHIVDLGDRSDTEAACSSVACGPAGT